MKRIIVTILAFIGGIVVFLIVLGVFGVSMLYRRHAGDGVPDKTVLELDLEQGLTEYIPDDPVAGVFAKKTPTVRDVVDTLEQAAQDKRVVALTVRVGGTGLGLAQIQEVRDAVIAFRRAGKPTIAHAEAFGEFGPGTGAYYLATAFEEIYLQPSGDVGLTGLIYESPFVRGTLDKLGIVPRLDHRREYKSAMNIFTERKFTSPHREEIQKVMESQFDQIVEGIAAARGLTEEKVRALVNQGPLSGQQAVEAKLIDGLAYRDEVATKVKKTIGENTKALSFAKYLDRVGRPHEKGEKTIALIYGVGAVQRGKGGYDPLSGGVGMGSDTLTAAFRTAIEDKAVKAILFRIDSPGGSYVASDTIWRETLRTKEAGKPVIASMGDVAGSGGYFVAMAADKIVAQPGTITGSIGVLAGKMLTDSFWGKVGVTWDEVHTSDNATLWTGTQDYTPAQWAQFQGALDRIYDDFTSKAAQGRNLPKEKLLEVAKGRIWTGEDAKALGLVDELGGFPLAFRLAKEAAGLSAEKEVRLEVFPRRKKTLKQVLMERLLEEDEDDAEQEGPVLIFARTLQSLHPLFHLVRRIGLDPAPGVLTMPEVDPAH